MRLMISRSRVPKEFDWKRYSLELASNALTADSVAGVMP